MLKFNTKLNNKYNNFLIVTLHTTRVRQSNLAIKIGYSKSYVGKILFKIRNPSKIRTIPGNFGNNPGKFGNIPDNTVEI